MISFRIYFTRERTVSKIKFSKLTFTNREFHSKFWISLLDSITARIINICREMWINVPSVTWNATLDKCDVIVSIILQFAEWCDWKCKPNFQSQYPWFNWTLLFKFLWYYIPFQLIFVSLIPHCLWEAVVTVRNLTVDTLCNCKLYFKIYTQTIVSVRNSLNFLCIFNIV